VLASLRASGLVQITVTDIRRSRVCERQKIAGGGFEPPVCGL
jgi:hypothetical protein